ncbi:hypothetical protein OB920_08135 [Halobacteria archaeon HArc-gm2]|nr:hypothetical protein [Halobacteria archaeon HArc-gm2]
MSAISRSLRTPHALAAFGGLGYAAALFWWFSSRGLHFSSPDPVTTAIGFGYSVGGLFLLGAVPLYLLVRFSLVTPVLATGWTLGNTVYQHLYGTHLHPLSSYLIVWPLLFGLAVLPGAVEALVRLGLDRGFDRFGLRPLV